MSKLVWFYLCLTNSKSVLSNIWSFKHFYYWGQHHIVEYKLPVFNSFFNGCNNLWGLSGRDNILWMIVASKFHLSYIWPNWQPSDSSHIIDHLNIELLLYTFTWLCQQKHCAAECVDGSIIYLPKGFNVHLDKHFYLTPEYM